MLIYKSIDKEKFMCYYHKMYYSLWIIIYSCENKYNQQKNGYTIT